MHNIKFRKLQTCTYVLATRCLKSFCFLLLLLRVAFEYNKLTQCKMHIFNGASLFANFCSLSFLPENQREEGLLLKRVAWVSTFLISAHLTKLQTETRTDINFKSRLRQRNFLWNFYLQAFLRSCRILDRDSESQKA